MTKISAWTKEKIFMFGIGVSIIASIPIMMFGLWKNGTGHDMFFHLMRIEGLSEGILSGQFPVRIQPGWYNGYGYACSVFYGDILLLFPALLHMAGVPLQAAYKIYIIAANIATFFVAFYSFKGIFKENLTALIGATWYTLSLYRLINVYIRHAVGEHTAMVFFPLIGYALFCLLKEEPLLSRGVNALVIGVSGILQSHIISFEITIGVMLVVCIIYCKRVLRKNVVTAFLKAAGLTILFNLWFLVPLLDYMKTGLFNANAVNEYKKSINIGDSGLFPRQLFGIVYGAAGVNQPVSGGIDGEMPLGVGISSLFIIIISVYILIRKTISRKDEETSRFGWVILLGCISSLWLSTWTFPWSKLEEIHDTIRYTIINIQFPWRFLGVSSVMISMLVCLAINEHKSKTVCGVLLLAGILLVISDSYLMYDESKVSEKVIVRNVGDLNTSEPSGEEYLPYGTDVKELTEGDVRTTNVTITNWNKEHLTFTATVENGSEEQGYVLTPMLLYKGYKAILDDGGNRVLDVSYGFNKRVLVTVPPGAMGNIKVYWSKPTLWWASDAVSLLSIIVCFVYYRKKGFAR